MTEDKSSFDDLLDKMPAIAKAVADFPEAVQQSAFDLLMAAATGVVASPPSTKVPPRASRSSSRRARTKAPAMESSTANAGSKARRPAPAQPKIVKELDLRPKGKTSFSDFVNSKMPSNNHDKHAVAVYWLQNEAQLGKVTCDDVFTAWRDMGWKLPPDFMASLRLTASKKRFLDTSSSDNLRLLNTGVNRVEHDLPFQKKGPIRDGSK